MQLLKRHDGGLRRVRAARLVPADEEQAGPGGSPERRGSVLRHPLTRSSHPAPAGTTALSVSDTHAAGAGCCPLADLVL